MRNIVITGASRGIGKATVLALAQPGVAFFLTGRDTKALEQVASEAHAKGARVEILAGDLRETSYLQRLVQRIEAWASSLDAVILNAGVARVQPILETSLEDYDLQMDVNVRAAFYLARHLALKIRPYGLLLFVGSIAGHRVFPHWGVYCATKHALRALATAFRIELKPRKVRVTLISPGAVDTDLWQGIPDPRRETMLMAEDIARWIRYALEEPNRVDVEEVVLTPTER